MNRPHDRDAAPQAGGRHHASPGGARGASTWRACVLVACVALLVAGGLLLVRGLRPGPAPDAPLPSAPFSVAAPAPTPAVRAADRHGAPSRLRIASLGVDAPLEDVTLDPAGGLVIPGDPSTVGRWTGGAGPRDGVGTMLLAGHVDSDGRLGALHDLARIAPDARVETTDSGGLVTVWRVTGLRAVHKDEVPTFDRSGAHRLVLVTCGGRVLHTAAGATYEDNVIVTAVPA